MARGNTWHPWGVDSNPRPRPCIILYFEYPYHWKQQKVKRSLFFLAFLEVNFTYFFLWSNVAEVSFISKLRNSIQQIADFRSESVDIWNLPLIVSVAPARVYLCTCYIWLNYYAGFQVPLACFAIIQLSVIWGAMRFRRFDLQIILYTLVCSFSFEQSTGF